MEGQGPNIKKWMVLYPIYINSKKTIAEGRRISAAKACENPTCLEIVDCCNYLKIPSAIEVQFHFAFLSLCLLFLYIFTLVCVCVLLQLDKAYPRDFMQRGRVRVLLRREDGSPYNPAIGTSKDVILIYFEAIGLYLFSLLIYLFVYLFISILWCTSDWLTRFLQQSLVQEKYQNSS